VVAVVNTRRQDRLGPTSARGFVEDFDAVRPLIVRALEEALARVALRPLPAQQVIQPPRPLGELTAPPPADDIRW
jgi:hypothetical protein